MYVLGREAWEAGEKEGDRMFLLLELAQACRPVPSDVFSCHPRDRWPALLITRLHLSFGHPMIPSADTEMALPTPSFNEIARTGQVLHWSCEINASLFLPYVGFHHTAYSLTYCQASELIYYNMQQCRLA